MLWQEFLKKFRKVILYNNSEQMHLYVFRSSYLQQSFFPFIIYQLSPLLSLILSQLYSIGGFRAGASSHIQNSRVCAQNFWTQRQSVVTSRPIPWSKVSGFKSHPHHTLYIKQVFNKIYELAIRNRTKKNVTHISYNNH